MLKKLATVMMCLIMTVAFMPWTVFAETGPTATDIKTDKDSNGNPYYKSFKIGDVTYYDVGGGAKVKLDESGLKKIVQDNLLSDWVEVASYCWNDAGKYAHIPNGKDFSKRFLQENSENCWGDIRPMLKTEVSYGKVSHDNMHSTGLQPATSLSEVRDAMIDEVYTRIDRYSLRHRGKHMIYEQAPEVNGKNEGVLPELNKDDYTKAYYTIVTSINEQTSCKYIYNSYGICFYDFDVVPVSAENLVYKTALDGHEGDDPSSLNDLPGVKYDSSKSDFYVLGTKNDSDKSSNTQIEYSDTVSGSFENHWENSTTLSYGQSVTGTFNWGCKLPNDIVFSGGSLSIGFDFSQVYTRGEGGGASQSDSKTISHTSGIEVPPHTRVDIQNASTSASVDCEYDTPVMLRYKVAVFSISSDCYADSAATCYFGTSGYECSYYVNIFGGDEKKGTSGESANDNLYHRYVKNYKDGIKDSAAGAVHGFFKKYISQGENNDTNMSVNWGNAHSDSARISKANSDAIENQAKKIPILSCGCSYSVSGKSNVQTIGQVKAMYLPVRFAQTKGYNEDTPGYTPDDTIEYTLMTGNVLDLDSQLAFELRDSGNVPFYGYTSEAGEWAIADDGGGCVSLSGGKLKAEKPGQASIVWKLRDGVKYTATEETGTAESIKSDPVTITVKDEPFKPGVNVRSNGKTFAPCVGDEGLNINDYYYVRVYDASGKEISVPVTWEQSELEGITVAENGDISFTKAGTYKFRAKTADGQVSDWIETEAKAERKLHTVKFNNMILNKGMSTGSAMTVDLESFLDARDQYGDPWKGDLSDVAYMVAGSNDAEGKKLEGKVLRIDSSDSFMVVPVLLSNGGVNDARDAGMMVHFRDNFVLDKDVMYLTCGGTGSIKAIGPDGKEITSGLSYESSDEAVASVSEDGTVTGKKLGTAVITVSDEIGDSETCNVSVGVGDLADATVDPIGKKTYTGKAIKPAVTVKYEGRTLKEGTDFTVKYRNNRKTGKAKAVIEGTGNYKGIVVKTFRIVPGKAGISGLKAGKKKLTVKMKAAPSAKGASSYQIAYRIKGKSKWKYRTVSKSSAVIKKLKKNKRYQVKARALKNVKGVKYYGKWSSVRTSAKIK